MKTKKLISLLLVVCMLCSLGTAAFATTDYTNGTDVIYNPADPDGIPDSGDEVDLEAYTITVPAKLLPGTEGPVTLHGKWAANRIVVVTAEKSVELVNSINANDKKTLTVIFDGISEKGDNEKSQTFVENVKVSAISDALFGTWSGHFSYNVDVEDVAGEQPTDVVMLEGDGQVVNKFAFPEVRFRSSAPVDTLTEVKINGEVVSPDNYIVTEGSTIVTFKNDYIQTLDLGESFIEIISANGTADGDFTVINVIPDGGLYIAVDGTEYGPGEKFPNALQPGDMYYYGDYEYCYGYQWCSYCGYWSHIINFCGPDPVPIDHWGIHVSEDAMEKTEYGLPLAQINGDYISDWTGAFADCYDLKIAPEIPNTVTNLTETFANCRKLVVAPAIPDGITSLDYTFSGCTSLTVLPVIPNSVTSLSRTFSHCDALIDLSDFVIPNSVTDLAYAFFSCENLINAPVIPENVTNMNGTFSYCTSLIDIPVIPTGVTNMDSAFIQCDSLIDLSDFIIPGSVTSMNSIFAYCESLKKSPIFAEGVTDMQGVFLGCTALTEAPIIPNSVTNMSSTFSYCISLINAPTIPAGVTNMKETFASCTALTGMIEINANPQTILNCFGGRMIAGVTYSKVDFAKQNITLTGTSTMLDQLGATGLNYCATCNGVCTE